MKNKKKELTETEKCEIDIYEQELQAKLLEQYQKEIKRCYIVNIFYIEKSFQEELFTKERIITEVQKCKSRLSRYKSDEKYKIKVNDDKMKKEFVKILNNTFEKVYKHLTDVESIYKYEVAGLSKIVEQDVTPENINAVDLKFVKDEFKNRMEKFNFADTE